MTAASADLTRLAEDFRRAGESARAAAARVVSQTAQEVQAKAAAKAPRKTGALSSSVTIRMGSSLVAVVGPQEKYGVYQEFGTASRGEFGGQPYEIKPKRASVLAFEVNGKQVFAKKVVHPGVKAQPFMRPALQEALGPFMERLLKAGAVMITKGPRSVL